MLGPHPTAKHSIELGMEKNVAPPIYQNEMKFFCDPQLFPSIHMKEFVTPFSSIHPNERICEPQFPPSIQMKEICDHTHPSKLQKKTQNKQNK